MHAGSALADATGAVTYTGRHDCELVPHELVPVTHTLYVPTVAPVQLIVAEGVPCPETIDAPAGDMDHVYEVLSGSGVIDITWAASDLHTVNPVHEGVFRVREPDDAVHPFASVAVTE